MKVQLTQFEQVFSTYVEVFLNFTSGHRSSYRFLHVCGGVSLERAGLGGVVPFSPRMWRCFWLWWFQTPFDTVFSTYVEVFPSASSSAI